MRPASIISLFLWFLLSSGTAWGQTMPYIVTGSDVNVRSGPGTQYSKVGKLQKGETVDVVYLYDDNWAKIHYGTKSGFVSRKYIELDEHEKEAQSPLASSPKSFSFQSTLYTVWRVVKTVLIIGLILLALAFKEELMEIAFYLAVFMGIGALISFLIIKNGYWGAGIGLVVALVIVVRNIIDFDNAGVLFRFFLLVVYYVFSFPFYVLNQLQYILSEPWRYCFKSHGTSDATNRVLRPILEAMKIILYIALIPLRAFNAVYFNIVVHGLTELYDLFLEVLVPCSDKEGASGFWRWLLMLPWRILRYPVFHGFLTLLECIIWTIIDIIYPAITLYHGTDLTAGQSITGSRHRNKSLDWKSGTFLASQSSWGGIGVYFAASRKVAFSYAHDPYRLSDRDPIILVCRVSPGRIINYSLAPWYVFNAAGQNGHPPTINRFADNHHFMTGEWWNERGGYWEYCLFDWQNRYNQPWRIRPIYVYNSRTRIIQHIKGGMAHWLFKF